jgi:hypothetical protein
MTITRLLLVAVLLTAGGLRTAAWAAQIKTGPGGGSKAKSVAAAWSAEDVAECRRSKTVGLDRRGGLTLIDRDLVQYEIGSTVHSRAKVSAESVGGSVWVKKEFLLQSAGARTAELCVFTNGRVLVNFNGKQLPSYTRLHIRARPYSGVYPEDKFAKGHKMHHMNGKPYREYWQGGWERVPLDPKLLRKGVNTVILRSKPGENRRFLIEQSLYPNRSAVSRDGGATWDYDRLSRAGNINGEYIVRLALGRHPAGGWIESESVDLWPRGADQIAVPADILRLKLERQGEVPPEVGLKLAVRLGSTPAYHPGTWTPWCKIEELARGRARGKPLPAGNHRFLQWRAELSAASDRAKAPQLAGVKVTAEVRPRRLSGGLKIESCKLEQPPIVRSSHPFAHAANTKRLRLLREHTKLDDVVKGKARGVEQLLAIAKWTKDTFGKNAGGKLLVGTNWDALMLWNNARGKDRLTGQMCTHRAAFFVQCATALGYPARPCIWSHAIAEAWVDDLGTWVAFDPSGRFYFELDGKPASMAAVSMVWDGTSKGTPRQKVRKVWGKKNKSQPETNRNLAWFTRFWLPLRSNYLESPAPYEPGHGNTSFKHDGYLRWLHPRKKPLPWFSFYTSRRADIDFTVSTVNIHLARSGENGALRVLLETDEPRPARYEVSFAGKEWTTVKSGFAWKLSPGKNVLKVRTVSTFEVPGRFARAVVTVRK